MAIQTTVEMFEIRFALPLKRLHEVLRECEVATGSLANVEPFAERLERAGTLSDAMATALRTVAAGDGIALTRMEMLELLCIAVSGTDVESSGPALRRSLRQMLVFVNGVLLSMQPQVGSMEASKEAHGADAHQPRAGMPQDDPDAPEHFYVVESFKLLTHHAQPAPGTAALVTTAPETAAARAQPAAGGDEQPEADWLPERTRNVPTVALPAFGARAKVALKLETHEPIARDSRQVEETSSAELPKTWEDVDAGENPVPVAKTQTLLSQPALLACAVLVSFVAGMAVPHFAFGRPSPLPSPVRDSKPSPAPSVVPGNHVPAGTSSSRIQDMTSVPASLASVNLLYSPQPEYPAVARLTHVEGEVVLAIVVSPHGSVVSSRVLQGQPILRGAAEKAVRQWQFRPFVCDGSPCQVQTSVVVDVVPPLDHL